MIMAVCPARPTGTEADDCDLATFAENAVVNQVPKLTSIARHVEKFLAMVN